MRRGAHACVRCPCASPVAAVLPTQCAAAEHGHGPLQTGHPPLHPPNPPPAQGGARRNQRSGLGLDGRGASVPRHLQLPAGLSRRHVLAGCAAGSVCGGRWPPRRTTWPAVGCCGVRQAAVCGSLQACKEACDAWVCNIMVRNGLQEHETCARTWQGPWDSNASRQRRSLNPSSGAQLHPLDSATLRRAGGCCFDRASAPGRQHPARVEWEPGCTR